MKSSIPSPAPLFKETSLWAGFLLSTVRTLHRTSFDYSRQSAHPFGASARYRTLPQTFPTFCTAYKVALSRHCRQSARYHLRLPPFTLPVASERPLIASSRLAPVIAAGPAQKSATAAYDKRHLIEFVTVAIAFILEFKPYSLRSHSH